MNTANLDLCRELYELSGWKPENWFEPPSQDTGHLLTHEDVITGYGGEIMPGALPAYDLGFLLRKLPPHITLEKHVESWWCWNADPDDLALTSSIGIPMTHDIADTPEDAAAKLAIKLFTHGTLKREE